MAEGNKSIYNILRNTRYDWPYTGDVHFFMEESRYQGHNTLQIF